MFCQNNDNSQTWVRARNLKVDNARVNITPKNWIYPKSITGLNSRKI